MHGFCPEQVRGVLSRAKVTNPHRALRKVTMALVGGEGSTGQAAMMQEYHRQAHEKDEQNRKELQDREKERRKRGVREMFNMDVREVDEGAAALASRVQGRREKAGRRPATEPTPGTAHGGGGWKGRAGLGRSTNRGHQEAIYRYMVRRSAPDRNEEEREARGGDREEGLSEGRGEQTEGAKPTQTEDGGGDELGTEPGGAAGGRTGRPGGEEEEAGTDPDTDTQQDAGEEFANTRSPTGRTRVPPRGSPARRQPGRRNGNIVTMFQMRTAVVAALLLTSATTANGETATQRTSRIDMLRIDSTVKGPSTSPLDRENKEPHWTRESEKHHGTERA